MPVGSAAALPPEAAAVDSAATASSSPMVPSAASAMTTLPSPMAPAPDRPEGLVTYSVPDVRGSRSRSGDISPLKVNVFLQLHLNRDGVLVPAVADGQQEDGEEEEEEEDDAETNPDRDPPGRDPPDPRPPW